MNTKNTFSNRTFWDIFAESRGKKAANTNLIYLVLIMKLNLEFFIGFGEQLFIQNIFFPKNFLGHLCSNVRKESCKYLMYWKRSSAVSLFVAGFFPWKLTENWASTSFNNRHKMIPKAISLALGVKSIFCLYFRHIRFCRLFSDC